MEEAAVIEFIKNLEELNTQEVPPEWWPRFRQDCFTVLEFDDNGRVLVVIAREEEDGWAQTIWVRALTKFVNAGLKRELKSGEILEPSETVDVDGVLYTKISPMAHFLLSHKATHYLIEQYADE